MKHSPAKLAKQRKRAAELKAVFAKKGRKPLGVVVLGKRKKKPPKAVKPTGVSDTSQDHLAECVDAHPGLNH